MRSLVSLIFILLIATCGAQVSCDQSAITPSNIFYPGSNSNYTSGGNYLYLCGPNTLVYDTTESSGNCHAAFVEAGSVLNFKNPGCFTSHYFFLKDNSTLIIRPGTTNFGLTVVSEPLATVVNQAGISIITYTCSNLIFPTINCFSGIKDNYQNIQVKVFPNPSGQFLSVFCLDPDFSPEWIIITDNLGIEIKTTEFSNSIDISSIPSGSYTIKLCSKYSSYQVKFIKE